MFWRHIIGKKKYIHHIFTKKQEKSRIWVFENMAMLQIPEFTVASVICNNQDVGVITALCLLCGNMGRVRH